MHAEADGISERAAVMALLWEGRRASNHGPVAGLSLARIAEAGIRVADDEGLAAVSMGRVAGECDYKRMSLYRYVPGRRELLALMTDAAYQQARPMPEGSDGWRSRTSRWAAEHVSLLRRHLWLLETTIGPRMLGPHELSWLKHGCGAFVDAGLGEDDAFHAALLIAGQVRGTLAHETRRLAHGDSPPPLQDEAVRRFLATHHEQGQAVASAVASTLNGTPRDPELAWALERCLDGLSCLVDAQDS